MNELKNRPNLENEYINSCQLYDGFEIAYAVGQLKGCIRLRQFHAEHMEEMAGLSARDVPDCLRESNRVRDRPFPRRSTRKSSRIYNLSRTDLSDAMVNHEWEKGGGKADSKEERRKSLI